MRYLTKDWYKLCGLTDLHYDLAVTSLPDKMDEALFARTYQEEESAFVDEQQELYDLDPRTLQEQEGLSPLNLFQELFDGLDEDELELFSMSMPPIAPTEVLEQLRQDEEAELEEQIRAYDARPPFDIDAAKKQFRRLYDERLRRSETDLSEEILEQITDLRLYTLGLVDQASYDKIVSFCNRNDQVVRRVLAAFESAQSKEAIPMHLAEGFGAHDAIVIEAIPGTDIVLKLDLDNSFGEHEEIRFTNARILSGKLSSIIGSAWLYNELYRTDDGGYEAHMLFSGQDMNDAIELTIKSEDLILG